MNNINYKQLSNLVNYMQAGKISLLEFLGDRQQSILPIYQRKYSWTTNECKQLWDDILRIGEDEEYSEGKNHFLGSIVYTKLNPFTINPINQRMIIDGQQRMTTISLLISAIADFLFENPNDIISSEVLISSYLLNSNTVGENRYKLILTQDDKNTLFKLFDYLENNEKILFDKDKDSLKIQENFEYFRKKINAGNVEAILNGLNRLLIIYISLEPKIDNPQLIFESLNSTGMELTQADLIRNFILMGLKIEEQEKLYNDYWHDIEKLFEELIIKEKNKYKFDKFIRDYLTVKTGRVSYFRNIYRDFKLYSSTQDVNELVKDIYTYASYFKCIALGAEEDPKLKKSLDSLRNLGYDVTDPFLLHLYRDYKEKKLSRDEFCDMLMYTESYLFRRLICSIPTPSQKKTFEDMYGLLDTTNYLESYKYALLSKENYQRMPNDEEFTRNFWEKDIFNLKNKDYILFKFENWKHDKEIHKEDGFYTIEHIMPQDTNLCEEWILDLGENWREVHKKYLHTIGNLTITGYNPEYSKKPFLFKRDLKDKGFRYSIFRLNNYLAELNHWNEDEIKKRANMLIKQAQEIWPYPY